MRKHFLILMLMTLLPLAGWAYDFEVDVEVKPYNASVVWSGVKPIGVETSWIGAPGSSLTTTVKNAIAEQLEINNLADYNVGIHNYYLQLKSTAAGYVVNDDTRYNIRLNDANTAQLTITKFEEAPVFNTTALAFVDGDLVYTGEAQALLSGGATATANGFTVPVVYTTKATPAETDWVALADLKETNANTTGYTVKYKVVGTDNYAGSAVQTLTGSKAIAQLNQNFNADGAKPTANTWTYDAQAHALFTAPTAAVSFGTYEYSLTGADETWYTSAQIAASEELTAAFKGTSNTGNKTVYWRVLATDNYTGFDAAALTATIEKATPVITNPTFKTGLVYDGTAQALINVAATATYGATVSYRTQRSKNVNNTWTGWEEWVTDAAAVTGTAAAQYQVQVKTTATDDLNAVAATLLSTKPKIAKATIPTTAYALPVAKTSLRNTGSAQELVTAASWTGDSYGALQYSTDGNTWSTNIPKGTDAGNYTVYFRIYPTVVNNTQNYNEVTATLENIVIAAKAKVTVTTKANQSFGYGTTPVLEKTVAWEEQGEDALNEEGLVWNWYTDEECNTAAVANASGYYAVGDYYVKASGLAVTGETAASQEIVYVPALVKITAGQVNATISGTATYGSLPTFTLTHTSGLSEAEAENFNAANNLSKVTVKKGTEVLAENVASDNDALKALAVGEYDLEATAAIAGGQYVVFVTAGKLNVSAKADANLTVTITAPDGGFTYKAAKWENFDDNVTVKDGEATLTKGTDYTITYGDNDHDNIKAGDGIVKITGAGNYAGATKSQTFNIAKAALTIKADDFTGDKAWQYGEAEPTYTITATGLQGDETLAVGGTLVGIDGTLQVKRTSNETVGMHANALVPYFKDGDGNAIATPVATNYTLTLTPGNLQVAKAALAIKLKEAVVGTYGDDPAANITAAVINNIANYELDNCELPGANLADVVNVAGVAYEIEAIDNNKYLFGTDYEFTLTGATSTNYTVTISKGTYKVNPAAITLYAKDQAINWADEDNTNDEANTTVSDATVAIAAGALKCGDALTDVVASINIAGTKVGNNNITLTAATNANYNIAVNKDADGNDKIGNLTVTGGATITLTRVAKANIDNATVAQLIKDYDGQTGVNVTIKFADTDGLNTLKPNKWYAFILPFETDAKMISDAFGYAIVDLLNTGNTDTHKTVFSLKMNTEKIPANTPFIVKVWDTVNMTTGVTFNGVKIVAPEAYDEIAVSDAAGNQFIGSYTGINGLGNYKSGYSGHVFWWSLQQDDQYDNNALKPKDTVYLRQMSAFSYVPGDVAAHEFIIEELGGNTTVIRGINIDGENISTEGLYNMNGMKLNSVPTQKGIYIQNGKKVVIK